MRHREKEKYWKNTIRNCFFFVLSFKTQTKFKVTLKLLIFQKIFMLSIWNSVIYG